jgi:SAM-dependent methyltransferase
MVNSRGYDSEANVLGSPDEALQEFAIKVRGSPAPYQLRLGCPELPRGLPGESRAHQEMKSFLVRLFGFPATLAHGDTLVLDRWLWLKRELPQIPSGSKKLLDIGCGTGAFTIGAARRGYHALGLSWDERNQKVAEQRAKTCKAPLAGFQVLDVRQLDRRGDLREIFDVVVCCENIEHILDDRKLMMDMERCLKPGGTLLLTTPNLDYKPMTAYDNGPFSPVEDGGHVRRGYSQDDLERLCASAGLKASRIGYCSGYLSQKVTAFMRAASAIHPLFGWSIVLPLRILPPAIDPLVSKFLDWPGYSITLVARK